MDFTSELSAFQGALISAENVHSFSRLSAKGGNEDQINYIVQNLFRFLEQQNYISRDSIVPEKEEKVRKFAFYLILNADLPVLQQLVENGGIDSVIWTIPTISRCLMSEMLWKLHMTKFVKEAISFSHPQLALELANATLEHIKYFTPHECLDSLQALSTACYKLICRLHFFKYEMDVLTSLITNVTNNFQRCLNYFIEPPNSEKLQPLHKDDLYKYKGFRIRALFNAILECIAQYTSIQEFAPENFNPIYQMTYKAGSYTTDAINFVTCHSPNRPILYCLDKFNELFLDASRVLVMDVNVEIFCAWSEFDENGKTMQQSIGETAYKLRSILMSIDIICEHPVVPMFQQISRKPVDIQDLVNLSDSDTIQESFLNSDGNRAEWIRALLHKDNLCQDSTLIELLSSNINVLNSDESHVLYTICESHLENETENIEAVKLLAVKSLRQCDSITKYEILEEHFNGKCFTDAMETTEFNNMLTEIFNKLIATYISEADISLTDVLVVFFQNPQKVYTKIFNLSSETSHQADIMLKTMKLLENFSNHYYKQDTEPCLIRLAETILNTYLDRDHTQQNFIKFLCGLKSMNIIPGAKLLLLIIMPNIHQGLLEKNVLSIHFQCKLLSEAFTLEELLPYRAPMLAMIAQILEAVRWKITSFKGEAPAALELALALQKKLFETYDAEIPEKEESWLKSKLKLHPLNCYYYRKLWNPPGACFVEVVGGTPVSREMDIMQLVSWMSQVLCSTSQSEWCEIWDNLSVFDNKQRLYMYQKAMMILTLAEAANRDENVNSWECVKNCYMNFVYVIRYKFFTEPLTNDQVTVVVQKVSSFADAIKEQDSEPICTILLPLFAYIVGRKADYTVNVSRMLNEYVKNAIFKDTVSKVFSNGSV